MFGKDEKEIIESDGDLDLFYYKDFGNEFGIGFDKIFNRKELSAFNGFMLNSKRNFKNLADSILRTYNNIFLSDEEKIIEDRAIILFNILKVKSETTTSQTSLNEFLEKIDFILDSQNSLLLRIISDYVETNYNLELDKGTEEARLKNKKINTELQFTDFHAKELLKVSELYRLMIPLISEFLLFNKDNFAKPEDERILESENEDNEDLEFDDINSCIFDHLFGKIVEEADNLKNKLYRLVYSRIVKTSYSDSRFWKVANTMGITKESEALEIYKKVMTNALPKLSLEAERSVVSFFQSVVNNQIDFLFQNKFKYKFSVLGQDIEKKYSTSTDEDDDSITEYERIENKSNREDEGSFVIRKLNNEKILKEIQTYFDVGVLEIEVQEFIKEIKRNSIQEEIVGLLTFKYFKDCRSLKYLDFYQYCYLVILCKKFLKKHKFVYLPDMLVADCEKHKERANICGKKVRPKILESKKFTELIRSKYKNFYEEIEKPFLSLIGTIYSSVFKNKEGQEIFDSSVKVGKIAEELVDLLYLV